MSIHINYESLREDKASRTQVDEQLLRKAKGFFGRRARQELIRKFDSQMRVMATEIAQRQANPQTLYQAGTQGILDALRLYEVGQTREPFRDFALPIIRQQMLQARAHHT